MASTHNDGVGITASQALRRLVEGNRRFVRGEARFPTVQKKILRSFAREQRPYATILGCSDSRVPPELLFDAGFGELFVIRVAGNVLSADVAGSLQYAGVHLKTPLFLVLGHEGCGAVGAAVDTHFHSVRHRSRISKLVRKIVPAIRELNPLLPPDLLLSNAVEANVRWTMNQIRSSPEGKVACGEGRLKLAGAIYEIEKGGSGSCPDGNYGVDERAGVLTVQLARRAHLRALLHCGLLSALFVPMVLALPRMWRGCAAWYPRRSASSPAWRRGGRQKGRPPPTIRRGPCSRRPPPACCSHSSSPWRLTSRSARSGACARRSYRRGGDTFAFGRDGRFSVNGGDRRDPADALLVRSFYHRDSGENHVVDEQFLYLVRGRRALEVMRSSTAGEAEALARTVGDFLGVDTRQESQEGSSFPFGAL